MTGVQAHPQLYKFKASLGYMRIIHFKQANYVIYTNMDKMFGA